jgi:hypothetical protein
MLCVGAKLKNIQIVHNFILLCIRCPEIERERERERERGREREIERERERDAVL